MFIDAISPHSYLHNSVLDDKLLTLPSGDRLSIPKNVCMILEIALSRRRQQHVLVMKWFGSAMPQFCQRCASSTSWGNSGRKITLRRLIYHYQGMFLRVNDLVVSRDSRSSSLCADAFDFALSQSHIMEVSREGLIKSFKCLVVKVIRLVTEYYDENHPDFPMTGQHMDNFAKRWLLHSLLWSFAGSATWPTRNELSYLLIRLSGVTFPSDGNSGYLTDIE
jgi:dynein heavy chain 1